MGGNFDLLSAVQPADGWFAVVGIKEGTPVSQTLVATRAELDKIAQALVSKNKNVFFGVAKYASDKNRTKDNVLALKALWLDIDCGPDKSDKGYLTQQEGLAALRAFCAHVGLPKPIIVNSGRGLHVYWPLTEAVPRETWEPVAARLHELCLLQGLRVDPSVFECARILRVPGTYNFKGEEPLEVKVITEGEPHNIADLKAILGVQDKPNGLFHDSSTQRTESYLSRKLAEDRIKSFTKIMQMGDDGCRQLMSCYTERASLPEPRWFNALSVAKFCDDATKAIRKLSEGHPDYDPAKTAQKIRHISGPSGCVAFEQANPGGCSGCPHKGKIKSPIVLGFEIEQAPPEQKPASMFDTEGEEETYTIPKFPWPFFRGKSGGIYKHGTTDNPEDGDELVYAHDFYVLRRMRDPLAGEVIIARLHLPHDGVREFAIPNTKLTDATELRKLLSAEGLVCAKSRFELVMLYLIMAVSEIQTIRKAEQMRLQFGWADKDSKFIVGDIELSADGKFYSPPSATTAGIAQHLGPSGSYEEWKKVFALYNRPGLEPHAFAALTAFGAPLLKLSGQKGAIINMIHPRSGTGKTTALHMCNSVWGSPDRLCAVKEDTQNAKIMRLGIHNNLPVTYDEMTNIKSYDLSELIYCMTQGRGKDRMKSSTNELRNNMTTWQTIALCSSNASFYEKLSSLKHSPDGENMRIIEYKIDFCSAITPAEAKQAFDDTLLRNYGYAGLVYAEYLVKNMEHVQREYSRMRAKIDSEMGIQQSERYWSAVLAANIIGGLIAKKLDIHNWDINRIWLWASEMLVGLRADVGSFPTNASVETIGLYLNRHFKNVLIINEKQAGERIQEFPIKEPTGELLIRIEPNTNRMYIAAKPFQYECVEMQINYKETLSELRDIGCYLGAETKRLSSGLRGHASVPVYCYTFDTNMAGFVDLEAMLNDLAEEKDASGGSELRD